MPLRHFRLQDVQRLLRNAEKLELTSDVVQKLRWFQYALTHEGNVSRTCRYYGISRSTFLRWAKRFDAHDTKTLEEHSRRPHAVRQPETTNETIELIRTIRMQQPLAGKEVIAALLEQQHGVVLSASTIGRIIKRHKLFFADTVSHRSKRPTGTEDDTHELPRTSTRPSASLANTEDLDDPFLQLFPGITS